MIHWPSTINVKRNEDIISIEETIVYPDNEPMRKNEIHFPVEELPVILKKLLDLEIENRVGQLDP